MDINNLACRLKPNILLHLIIDGIPSRSMKALGPIDPHSLHFDEVLIFSWVDLSLVEEQIVRRTWLVINELSCNGGDWKFDGFGY